MSTRWMWIAGCLGAAACWSGLWTIGNAALVSGTSTMAGDRYGYQMASGDLNGDGIDDLAVSSPAPGVEGVFVFFGPVGGRAIDPANADFTYTGAAGTEAGWSLDVGDVYGSPDADLIIGEPSALFSKGRVVVVPGPLAPDVVGWSATYPTVDGSVNGQNLAWSVDHGDFDGDGRNELLIGACSTSDIGQGLGSAYVHTVVAGAQSVATAVTAFDGVGYTGCEVNALGDFDVDGYDDFAIGSPGQPGIAGWGGSVALVYGRASWQSRYDLGRADLLVANDIAMVVNDLPASGQNLGSAVTGADVNLDGIVDLVIGAPAVKCTGCTGAIDTVSEVYVVPGGLGDGKGTDRPLYGVSNVNAVAAAVWTEEAPGKSSDWAGISLSTVDSNNDGLDEVLVGTRINKAYLVHPVSFEFDGPYDCVLHPRDGYGSGFVSDCTLRSQVAFPYLGAQSLAKAPAIFTGAQVGDVFGLEVAGLGDVSGDGIPDIGFGAPRQATYSGTPSGPSGTAYVVAGKK